MEIIVLGTGCAKCKTVYERVEKVVKESGIEATIRKEEDIMQIMKYNVVSTPAIVVDGVVKVKGKVPTETEIKEMIGL